MERHKALYKDLNAGALSPRQYIRMNREQQNANRAEKRMQSYLNCRNISLSPSPNKISTKETISATSTPAAHMAKAQKSLVFQNVCTGLEKNFQENAVVADSSFDVTHKLKRQNALDIEDKENVQSEKMPTQETRLITTISDKKLAEKNTSRIAKVACSVGTDKLTRQEQFLKKYVDWKKEKKLKEEDRKKQQPKPFVPSGLHIKAKNKETPTSFAPKNYKFKPPVGLKQPIAKPVQLKQIDKTARQSIYTIVPTPPRKNKLLDLIKQPNPKSFSIKSDFSSNICQEKIIIPSSLHVNKNNPDIVLTNTSTVKTAMQIEKKKNAAYTPCALPPPSVEKKTNNFAESNTRNAETKSIHSSGTKFTVKSKTAGIAKKSEEPTKDKVTTSGRTTAATTSTHNFVKPRALQFPSVAARTTTTTNTIKRTAVNTVKSTQSSVNNMKPLQTNSNIKSIKISTNVNSAQKPTSNNTNIANTKQTTAIVVQPVQNRIVSKAVSKVNSGAIGKARVLQNKREVDKRLSHKTGNLSTNFKSKKADKLPQKNMKKVMELIKTVKSPPPILQTPIELVNVNPFEAFVTSTKMKSPLSGAIDDISDTISPVEPLESSNAPTQRRKSNINVKRALMMQDEKIIKEKISASQSKKRFNFLRHSVLEHESPPEGFGADDTFKNETIDKDKTMKTSEKSKFDESKYKTPPKVETDDRPANYLSPFVSVSRGKVSLKKEKEKRNSVYLVSDAENIANNTINQTEEATISVEVRRTLETVRYFRKQLNDEIIRLHSLCDSWEQYKSEKEDLLQENGGDDMINVTVGQTKLLTSKKFMQFSGLIDRCENGALGQAVADDGSEDTKLITAVDLEGFWSMLGLQIDNVDKRFENLKRWRDNNWVDPDAIVKPKPKLRKVKSKDKVPAAVASKSKPSTALQEMMRKIHAERRNNAKALKSEIVDNNIISSPMHKRRSNSGTPNSYSRSSTPRRISMLVRDRKSFSKAPTILTMTPTSRRSSISRKHSQESPKFVGAVSEFKQSLTNIQRACTERTDLLKTAIRGAEQQRRKSVLNSKQSTPSPPLVSTNGRKSILKTPGTAKGNSKNVNFNEQLRIKKFKFIIDDEDDSCDEQIIEQNQFLSNDNVESKSKEKSKTNNSNEDLVDKFIDRNAYISKEDYNTEGTPQREYRLRTRRVKLRPSCEIVIPK